MPRFWIKWGYWNLIFLYVPISLEKLLFFQRISCEMGYGNPVFLMVPIFFTLSNIGHVIGKAYLCRSSISR